MKPAVLIVAGCAVAGLTSYAAAQVWLFGNGGGGAFATHGPPPANSCSATLGGLLFNDPAGCDIVWMGG